MKYWESMKSRNYSDFLSIQTFGNKKAIGIAMIIWSGIYQVNPFPIFQHIFRIIQVKNGGALRPGGSILSCGSKSTE
jgi:hypothetical protein